MQVSRSQNLMVAMKMWQLLLMTLFCTVLRATGNVSGMCKVRLSCIFIHYTSNGLPVPVGPAQSLLQLSAQCACMSSS